MTLSSLFRGYQNMGSFNNILLMKYDYDIRQRKAANLRRLREAQKLKQKDIADIIDSKESNVSEMERGKRTISDRVINLLCRKWGIDPSEFYYTPKMPVIKNSMEQKVIERMRASDQIAHQIDIISEAIASESYGEKSFRTDNPIPKKKAKRKTA